MILNVTLAQFIRQTMEEKLEEFKSRAPGDPFAWMDGPVTSSETGVPSASIRFCTGMLIFIGAKLLIRAVGGRCRALLALDCYCPWKVVCFS